MAFLTWDARVLLIYTSWSNTDFPLYRMIFFGKSSLPRDYFHEVCMTLSSPNRSNHNSGRAFLFSSRARPANTTDPRRHQRDPVRNAQSNQLDLRGVLPTILLVAPEELRACVAAPLEAAGYLVLEAGDESEALLVVISQTRSIHILLADVNMKDHKLAEVLNPYRPEMRVLFIASPSQTLANALTPADAVARVRETLEVPEIIRKQVSANRTPSARAMHMIA